MSKCLVLCLHLLVILLLLRSFASVAAEEQKPPPGERNSAGRLRRAKKNDFVRAAGPAGPLERELAEAAMPASAAPEDPERQTLRFVQDDAQDYMVSKIYVLKHIQSNDITPFVTGIVKRYNFNSNVNCIEYGENNQQILTVTCPVGMMPYVDDFIAKADREAAIEGKKSGDIIRGTGITRAVYRPQYRSGQTLINLIVNAFINAGPYGSVYGYDANSNQIYWKDNVTNTEYIRQFLAFLDRPAPQINLSFRVYEVRESSMRDIGVDYLAWKNGPGLNLFQAAFRAFDLSSGGSAAISAMTGPLGGFFFAPQFDASFIRLLAQDGRAEVSDTAELTVSNSDSRTYEITFDPQLQNIVKSDNDRASVETSGVSGQKQIYLKIVKPVVCLHHGSELDFSFPDYQPGVYAKRGGSLFFGYGVEAANAVERNNYGAELVEMTALSGNCTVELGKEKILASWTRDDEVEQTVGAPFLSDIPLLGMLFSTTVRHKEKTTVCLTVSAAMLDTASPVEESGILKKLK